MPTNASDLASRPRRVLGVSCFYHDAAVAAVEDDRIVFAIHEERLSRRKHDASLPSRAIAAALDATGWHAEDVDRVVFYENPDWKLARLKSMAAHAGPHRRVLEEQAIPAFLAHKHDVASLIRREFPFRDIVCGEHHRSHAASAFYTSPFERAVVITVDGVGETESAAVFVGEGNELRRVKSVNFPDSLGLFYSVFTHYLGFEVNEGEYKVMGLAPYGRPIYLDAIVGPVLRLTDDGEFELDRRFFDFANPDQHFRDELVAHLGIAPRLPGAAMTQAHCDLAASVQAALEAALINFVSATLREHPSRDVCMAGGVALNCTANARLVRELGIRLHIHPAAGDAGGALGAALGDMAAHRTMLYRPTFTPYLGVEYSDRDIAAAATSSDLTHRRSEHIAAEIARRLAAGEVVGVLHGRDEWGPRALGARSILADPRQASMKDHLNAKIKFREEFRPFAPVVLEERYHEYFESLGMRRSPYMLFTHKALKPEQVAAVVHEDGTSRVQTVNRSQNAFLYDIIKAFEQLTGVPVVINTSFNLKGEPIVSSPADAMKTFLASGLDALALEDHIVIKQAAAGTAGDHVQPTALAS